MGEKQTFNRRDFLKIVGAGAGMAATGCGQKLPEKFIPYVVQPDDVVPGVSTWYAGSCSECPAGCGTLIRTREGRAVKVEGNPSHPISSGGLCTHGQSALQSLYDPDRIREPMRRQIGGAFAPAPWKDALDELATAMADAAAANKEVVLLTGPLSGSISTLIADFSKKFPALKHVEYRPNSGDAVQIAAEQVFGTGMRVGFDFSKADMIVGFGADYLESWISPVEYSRDWATARRSEGKAPARVVHFEPRLSLTAANADRWFATAPGSDTAVMLALLALVSQKAKNHALDAQIQALLAGLRPVELLRDTNVTLRELEDVAEQLAAASSSLVVAGGASTSGDGAVKTAVIANLINVALGNVGSTVVLSRASGPATSSYQTLVELLNAVATKQRNVGVLIVSGTNPAYSLPQKAKWKEAVARIGTFAAVSTQLDETTAYANIVLPMSHQLESWTDAEPRPGVHNLNQPSMQPLYRTQSLGDTLIALAANAKLGNAKFGELGSFHEYMQEQWKARLGGGDFAARWVDAVQRGGEWSERPASASPSGATRELDTTFTAIRSGLKAPAAAAGTFAVMAFPSVNSFDGQGANKPWLQELPNPITTTVWGTWVEMHPNAAAQLGINTGDVVQLVSDGGVFESPAYVTPHIHPGTLAVPIGQGHQAYGRYAIGVGSNAFSFLPAEPQGGQLAMLATGVKARRTISKDILVKLQGSDSQHNRGIARSISHKELTKLEHAHEHGGHGEHGGGHEDPLALGPRPEPKQMYKQMDHAQLPYHWGMAIDLAACTGCSACVVACYAENNIAVVGKTVCDEGREMSWIRIERYLDGPADRPVVGFVPMFCQHCQNAPCEPVCPVYATYHTEDGLNSMVYNRCVGTRYCLNNCSYKVRRFNWYKYAWPEPVNWQLNPDVTVREVGVMEKCTFCVQRIREGVGKAKDEGRLVRDGEVVPACASSCPTKAITFGNLNDKQSAVLERSKSPRSYKVLDVELNTQPVVSYLARVNNE